MSDYSSNRSFTDYVHNTHALSEVYKFLQWQPCNIDPVIAVELDNKHGIDYLFYCPRRGLVSVQERFRDGSADWSSDVTIRYTRPHSTRPNEKKSEFFKMKADVMLYGVIDGNKNDFSSIKKLKKYVMLDLKKLYEKFDSGEIVISKIKTSSCRVYKDKLIVPEIKSPDGLSTFLAIDVVMLVDLFGPDMFVDQKGYF